MKDKLYPMAKGDDRVLTPCKDLGPIHTSSLWETEVVFTFEDKRGAERMSRMPLFMWNDLPDHVATPKYLLKRLDQQIKRNKKRK